VREQIAEETRASPVQCMDETGWRVNGVNGYLWAQATEGPSATRVYSYNRSRGGQVARDLLGDFAGVLSTDFYSGYDGYVGPKQRCWAHLLRDVQDWVRALTGLYARATELDLTTASPRERAAAARECERRARALARCYRRTADHPARVLAERLHRHESALFEFLRTPGVPATNNLAERTIRPRVIARKTSGGSRSATGASISCDLAILFHTWAARGLMPSQACLLALQPSLPQVWVLTWSLAPVPQNSDYR